MLRYLLDIEEDKRRKREISAIQWLFYYLLRFQQIWQMQSKKLK